MANIAIFRINYKSDFILTLDSDAGWMTPFCIKFWTGAPSQAYFAGFDGETYTHCAPVEDEPTKLVVQFDDHHLPVGELKFQIGYHFTVDDFPTSVEDEVLNQAAVIIDNEGTPEQVMLDFTGETAPEIEFSLPAYANEAQRIANEEQRIENEQQRIANEETRQEQEAQRIAQETARVNEFATLKSQSQAATSAANTAASLANEKAQLADAAANLATQKAQLAADKAALAQQKAEYAQAQGDYAKAQGDTALADHERAVEDHTQASQDHTTAANDHITAGNDHTRAEADHTRAESDHAAVEVYVDSLGAFDISAYHATGGVLAKYADLTAALGTNGANIPEALRKGGMSVKFVQGTAQSSDNKYVQARCMAQNFTTDVTQWQGVDDEPTAGSDNLVKSGGVAEALDKSVFVKSNRKTILNTKEFINTTVSKTYDLPNVTSKFGLCVRLSAYNNVLVRVLEKDSNNTKVATINLKHRGDGIFSINWTKQNSNTVKATLQITNQTGSQIIIYEAWYVEGYDAFYDDVVTYVGNFDKSAALEGIVQLSTNYVPLTNEVYNPNTTNTHKKLNEQEFTVAAGTLLIASLQGMLESDKKYNFLFKLDIDDDSFTTNSFVLDSLSNKTYAYNLGHGHYGIFDFANAISFRIDNRNNNSDVVLKWAYCTKDYVPFVLNGGIVPELINNGAVKKEKLDVDAIGYTLARGTYDLIYSGQISTNGTTSVAGKTLSDEVVLESYKTIWYDFTGWEVGQKYSLITYCEDATPSVKDNNVTTSFVNCGNGIFILIDYIPVTSNVRVTITGNASGGLHKKTLIAKNAIPLNIPAKETIYSGTADYKDILEVDTDYNNIPTVVPRNRFKYPIYPVWGHEYLYSWYNKIDAGTADIYMAFAGDSTTEAKGRHTCAKKIMRLGGYPDNLVHSYDRGHGTMQTLQWIGEQLPSGVPVGGYLEQDMNLDETYQNPNLPSHPDLYVIAYGYNDGSPYNWPDLTVEERVAGFERRLREGLGRIRTNETFASGPSYNLSPDEMSVVICTPSSIPESNPVYGFVQRIRTVIEKACRDYHCAFVDITARQYDHTFSYSWSWGGGAPDGLHPTGVCVKDFMSMFADLIYPICFHVEQS